MANRYRKTAALSGIDAAYIAGLIDGEGTVTLSRKHAGENRQLVVSISSTERSMLEFVLERAGTGYISVKKVVKQVHSPSFAYSVWNRQALDLLKQVFPYLKSYKRGRAACIIRDYVRLTPRNGKYSARLAREREVFERLVLGLKARTFDRPG